MSLSKKMVITAIGMICILIFSYSLNLVEIRSEEADKIQKERYEATYYVSKDNTAIRTCASFDCEIAGYYHKNNPLQLNSIYKNLSEMPQWIPFPVHPNYETVYINKIDLVETPIPTIVPKEPITTAPKSTQTDVTIKDIEAPSGTAIALSSGFLSETVSDFQKRNGWYLNAINKNTSVIQQIENELKDYQVSITVTLLGQKAISTLRDLISEYQQMININSKYVELFTSNTVVYDTVLGQYMSEFEPLNSRVRLLTSKFEKDILAFKNAGADFYRAQDEALKGVLETLQK